MEFKFMGKTQVLRQKGKKVRVIGETQLTKAMENASHICMLQLLPTEANVRVCREMPNYDRQLMHLNSDVTPSAVNRVVEEHQDLFQEPKGLSPYRRCLTTEFL